MRKLLIGSFVLLTLLAVALTAEAHGARIAVGVSFGFPGAIYPAYGYYGPVVYGGYYPPPYPYYYYPYYPNVYSYGPGYYYPAYYPPFRGVAHFAPVPHRVIRHVPAAHQPTRVVAPVRR